MPDIKPHDPLLLTDEDVEYSHFNCCGDEDLVFLRCPSCDHVWVLCYECETWYSDLHDLTNRANASSSGSEHRLGCPHCKKPFADRYFLQAGTVDKYLPTAQQVIDAGFGKYLSPHQQKKYGISG